MSNRGDRPGPPRRPTRVRRTAGVALALILVPALLAACGSGGGAGDGAGRKETVDASVRVVTQNILHGRACPDDTRRCHLEDRLELFTSQLADAGCPEIVTLQEADATVVRAWRPRLAGVCRGRYRIVWDDDPGVDREVLATTLRVLAHERHRLAGPMRTASWVRLDAPVGEVDLVSTHLASGSDDGPCGPSACPPPCRASDTLNTCQGRQAAALLVERTGPRAVGILAGDLNADPDSATVRAITDAGLIDTARSAGQAECRSSTGVGCTSGRADTDESDLRDASSRQTERIDYVFVHTARRCRAVPPTGPFHPGPASPPGPGGLVFASDHTGVQASLRCRTTAADRAAAARPATTPTSRAAPAGPGPSATVPPATRAAIGEAFAAVFDGDAGPPEVRLASLEDAAALEGLFRARLTEQAALAGRIRARVDEVRPDGPDRAAVTFSLLLDGDPVIDHVAGSAVRSGGRWLVSRESFCQVANVGRPAPAPECAGGA